MVPVLDNQVAVACAAHGIKYSVTFSYSSYTLSLLLLLAESTQLGGAMPTAEATATLRRLLLRGAVHVRW